MLNPSDSIVDWVVKTVPTMGAGWCPPGMLGIGIGGTSEKAALLAKRSLMDPVDIQELKSRGPSNRAEELRLEIFEAVNALGIGAQGLGGLTTVVDVKILDYPTHAASLPIAMIPNCAATRHAHFELDGSGAYLQSPPSLDDWPQVTWEAGADSRRVNLDTVTAEEVASWKPGETLLLNGRMLTGRDAAHKRIQSLLASGEGLPEGVDFNGRFIYYVGPVDPVREEVVGPAGPTTSTRMDKFTDMMLDQCGLLGMIGKAERGPAGIDAIKKHGAVYLMAVGGAAYLVSKAIRESRIVAFEELGMEAIHEFVVEDMPVTVAVDSSGDSVHKSGPALWKGKIDSGEVKPVYFVCFVHCCVLAQAPMNWIPPIPAVESSNAGPVTRRLLARRNAFRMMRPAMRSHQDAIALVCGPVNAPLARPHSNLIQTARLENAVFSFRRA